LGQKSNINPFRYRQAPLVVARVREGDDNFYLMELCRIQPDQRVKTHQQTSKQSQEMIKKCAVAPAVLLEQNWKTVNALHLNNDSDYLSRAGLSFLNVGLTVVCFLLSLPTSSVNQFSQRGTWTTRSQYLKPAGCKNWAAYMR
jgi:hypothetical protein